MQEFLAIVVIAGAAALASPLGGLFALWRRPTTLFLSVVLGFAGGVLLGTIGFEMLPKAQELGSLPIAAGGFATGFLMVYLLDMFVNRGQLAGQEAEQRLRVERFHRRHRPRGSEVTVLATGTAVEELIEGLSIGIGMVIQPGLGLLVALAIVMDNVSEALSIGELIRADPSERPQGMLGRILGWTGLIGVSVFVSALAGWFFLKGLPRPVIGFLLGMAAGGIFYLTVTDLVPEAEERHYQQSAAMAMASGFLLLFALSAWL